MFRVLPLRALQATLVAFVAASNAGCARDAADRHAAELRESMARAEGEHERIGRRLGAGELAADDARGRELDAPASSAATPAPVAPAVPRVLQLGSGGGDGSSDDPDDPTARPRIELSGAGGSRAARGRGGSGRGTRIEVIGPEEGDAPDATPVAPGGGERPSALEPEARKAYDAALALVNGKEYDRALEALDAFLSRWPDHPYAENAAYWRGEIFYAKGDYGRAAAQMEAVLARFSHGNKSADALLKLGMCHERLGAPERAREAWSRLRHEHPRSDAARKIPGEPPATSRERTLPTDDRSQKGPKETR